MSAAGCGCSSAGTNGESALPGDAVGVTSQTAGYPGRGEYSPSLSLALRLAAVLEAPVDALFSLTPFPDTQETR